MSLAWLDGEAVALLGRGLVLTLGLTAITSALSIVLGVGMGTLKLLDSPFASRLAGLFIEIHRNVPALVLIVFWTFAFPNIFSLETRQRLFFANPFVDWIAAWTGLPIPYYALGAGLALTLNTSAYLAELYRAGVGTLQQEHVEAARSLGASRFDLFRRIVIPQGVRAAFPAISTRLIHNMKNTALAAVVATPEFFHSVQTAISRSFRAVELLLLAAVVYLCLSFAFSALLGWIERRLNRVSMVVQQG